MSTEINLSNKTFDANNTFNPNTADLKTDGESVLCFINANRPVNVVNCVIDGGTIHWGGKHSLTFDTIYTDCTFKNGAKRAFDMVRGGNIKFIRCKFLNDGPREVIKSKWALSELCDVGIKGGVRDVLFEDCELNDLFLGDYTIYDQIERPKTRRVHLKNCKNPNGGKVIIRARYADKNSIVAEGTDASILVWPEWVTSLYWWYNRKFGDKRKPDGWDVILPEEII